MVRYNLIRKMDIADGPGVRVSIFFQGCHFHCEECFNEETWDFNGGKEFTSEVIDRILDLAKEDYIEGLSILGGEPMNPVNRPGSLEVAKAFRNKYPYKNIWMWSGYKFEDIKDEEIFKYIDVLVDGQYKKDLHDFRLKWRGSSNQRVIDIPKSIKSNKTVLLEGEN